MSVSTIRNLNLIETLNRLNALPLAKRVLQMKLVVLKLFEKECTVASTLLPSITD